MSSETTVTLLLENISWCLKCKTTKLNMHAQIRSCTCTHTHALMMSDEPVFGFSRNFDSFTEIQNGFYFNIQWLTWMQAPTCLLQMQQSRARRAGGTCERRNTGSIFSAQPMLTCSPPHKAHFEQQHQTYFHVYSYTTS